MNTYRTLNSMGNVMGDSDVYMMIGHGARNQFRRLSDLKKAIQNVSKGVEKGSTMFYFGDYPDKKKPDIGYAHKLLSDTREDIHFQMIQIHEAKDWGTPDFVAGVYWHKDYPKTGDCKWGGFTPKGTPCSNTAKWVEFHKKIKPIKCIFVLGGGPITKQEVAFAKKIGIPVKYIPIERRFKGDKVTRITNKDPKRTRFGILGVNGTNITRKRSKRD